MPRAINKNKVCKICGNPSAKTPKGRRSHCHRCRNKLAKYKIAIIYTFECEKCGWIGYCDIHHKNGNHNDNNLENLESLCPNCHRDYHSPIPIELLEFLKGQK